MNSKKITSKDDIENVIGVDQSTPIASVQNETGSRTGATRDDSSIASGSSGFGSLTKKKANDFHSAEMDANPFISSIVTDSGISESSEPTNYDLLATLGSSNQNSQQAQANLGGGVEQGHSRNSSNTSQVISHPFRLFLALSSSTNLSLSFLLDVQRIGLQQFLA